MSVYGYTNESGEPIMDGAAYRFEQQLDAEYLLDQMDDDNYDEPDEPDEDEVIVVSLDVYAGHVAATWVTDRLYTRKFIDYTMDEIRGELCDVLGDVTFTGAVNRF